MFHRTKFHKLNTMELMLETYIIAVHVLFPYMFYMI